MEDTKTISLQGSTKLKWDDVDKKSEQTGFNNRSAYTQYLYEKDIFGKKYEGIITYVIMLLGLAAVSLLILLVVR